MAYSFVNSKGNKYYLHEKVIQRAGGKASKLFFFAREIKAGALDAVPAGYKVAEMKTGLPVLKKI